MEGESTTPSRTTTKRKVEGDAEGRKGETKKVKATFTPRTQGAKILRKTAAPPLNTPTRGLENTRAKTMAAETNAAAENNKKPEWLDGLSVALAKSLTTTLTATLTEKLSEDFKETLRGVDRRVNDNASSIGELKSEVDRIEHRGEMQSGGRRTGSRNSYRP